MSGLEAAGIGALVGLVVGLGGGAICLALYIRAPRR